MENQSKGRWGGLYLTDKLRNIVFIIEGDSSAITNAICPSLSVNYGSAYEWRFTANHGTGFTDEMRMLIKLD